ncbi:hypothetical protein M9H77_04728 [Catharanthus roseus]|uniref:Uncharacterized protein n=1 Tax=Catharanthus roseus TaxID=4058 RepID=A0ACC0CF24_CATRO|nr:hypothetical protein M9H77_04728 [Catharanthus roseus]
MDLKNFAIESLPFFIMVLVEFLNVGLTTLSKAVMSKGIGNYVFVFYSNTIAALILLPLSFILERNKRAPLSWSLLCKFFILSLIGITIMQNCVFTGLKYSSPTLASAMSNLSPPFTFLLAVIFRMEKMKLRSMRSNIKMMGTLVSITGALIVTLYKGPQSGSSSEEEQVLLSPTLNNWGIGGIFLAIASLSVSVWSIGQAAILRGYQSELTIVAFYCLFGSIQCGLVCLVAERNHPKAWK